jgi:long-chain acyl-CoA synthetase
MGTVTNAELLARVQGRNVCTEFLKTVGALGDQIGVRSMSEAGGWTEFTFAQWADQAARVAAGLAAMGVGPGDRVVMMLRNIPEFHIADFAVLFLGATPVSIYNSSSPEQVAYLAGHCGAKLAIVEDAGFLQRFIDSRDQLPALEKIVIVTDPAGAAGPDVGTWAELVASDPSTHRGRPATPRA